MLLAAGGASVWVKATERWEAREESTLLPPEMELVSRLEATELWASDVLSGGGEGNSPYGQVQDFTKIAQIEKHM